MRALIEFARKKKSQQCHSRRAIRKKTVGTRHTARWIIRPRALTKSQQQKSHFTSGFERNRQNRFFFLQKKETDRTKHSMRLSASEEAMRMRTRTTAPAHQDSTTRKKISNEKKIWRRATIAYLQARTLWRELIAANARDSPIGTGGGIYRRARCWRVGK